MSEWIDIGAVEDVPGASAHGDADIAITIAIDDGVADRQDHGIAVVVDDAEASDVDGAEQCEARRPVQRDETLA